MIRIGISGWRYASWRRVWYPEGLAQRRQLEVCGHHFPTVEINGSSYSLQRPGSYDAWYRATPPGFVFAVKGPLGQPPPPAQGRREAARQLLRLGRPWPAG